jgi:hypothetical protein
MKPDARIAQMLDEPALFPLADPVMGCTSTVMYEGDTHGWHFDLNDFVVSILLQARRQAEPSTSRPISERTARRITRPWPPPSTAVAGGALDQS